MSGFCCVCLCAWALGAETVTGHSLTSSTEQLNAGSDVSSLLHEATQTRPVVQDDPVHACGEGWCICHGNYAKCGPKRTLNYIPQLPSDITILDFQKNNLGDINDDTFVNVTRVGKLNLIGNLVSKIKSTAFGNVPNLHVLDLSFNPMFICESLSTVLNNSTLQKLVAVGSVRYCTFETDITMYKPRLQELNLSWSFFFVFNLTFLTPFTGLKRLILVRVDTSRHNPAMIYYQALYELKNLTFLDLSENILSCADLQTVLAIPSLEELRVRQGTFCTTAKLSVTLHPFTRSKLVNLDLSRNFIKGIKFNTSTDLNCSSFSELRYIDLSYNKLERFRADYLPQLQALNMRGNSFALFPDVCRKQYTAYFPSLVELDLSENEISLLTSIHGNPMCLTGLRILNLSKNRLSFLEFFTNNRWFQSLKILDASSQKSLGYIQGINSTSLIFPRLQSLIMDQNGINFTDKALVDIRSFSGCPHLKHISLADNSLKGVSEERFHQLLGHLVYLRHISLRSTRLTYITAGMFHKLRSLEQLDLSMNSLVVLPNAAFESASHLAVINLSFNKISVIKEPAFPLATRQRLQHIDLSANPIVCSCDVLWFQKWFISNPSLFGGSSSDYMCANFPDTLIQSFFMQEQACLLTPETSKFIIATVSLIFIGMNLVVFLYRYRWHIRLVLFEAFRARGDRLRRLREQHFEYDVFVAYDSEDFPWVRDHLMPNLEGRLGLKLCLHQRDFILGNPIVDNIEESMESSKKMLMLFSRNFAQSEWCQFELRLCLSHAMDTDDVLLVVMLREIPSSDLTPAMLAVMKTMTYIEWADDADATDYFWRRMRLALNEVLPNPRQEDQP